MAGSESCSSAIFPSAHPYRVYGSQLSVIVGLTFLALNIATGSEIALEVPYRATEYDCPEPNARFLSLNYIPWGLPLRAHQTIPPEVMLVESKIPGAGLGIIATTFIPHITWLGEYDGEIIEPSASDKEISWYAWSLYRGGELTHYVDAINLDTSSWHRWVNCPRNSREENVEAMECMGKIIYATKRDIYPGEELLVFYGDGYAKTLGIDVKAFTDGVSCYAENENITDYKSTSELRMANQWSFVKSKTK